MILYLAKFNYLFIYSFIHLRLILIQKTMRNNPGRNPQASSTVNKNQLARTFKSLQKSISTVCCICKMNIVINQDPYFRHNMNKGCNQIMCIWCLNQNFNQYYLNFINLNKSNPSKTKVDKYPVKLKCCDINNLNILNSLQQFFQNNCCIDGKHCRYLNKDSLSVYLFPNFITVGKPCYKNLKKKQIQKNYMTEKQRRILNQLDLLSNQKCKNCAQIFQNRLINFVIGPQCEVKQHLCIDCYSKIQNNFTLNSDYLSLKSYQQFFRSSNLNLKSTVQQDDSSYQQMLCDQLINSELTRPFSQKLMGQLQVFLQKEYGIIFRKKSNTAENSASKLITNCSKFRQSQDCRNYKRMCQRCLTIDLLNIKPDQNYRNIDGARNKLSRR